ncbi:MAG: hypothetical protein ACOH1R_01075 [Luteimonas sp.]
MLEHAKLKVSDFPAGGCRHDAPRMRAEYHPDDDGGLVFDHDGRSLDAACHALENDA